MTDLISRQEAILAIRRTAEPFYRGEDNVVPAEYEDAIMELPTINLVKHGKWKTTPYTDYDDAWECSACGCLWTFIEGTPKDNGANYCPNCGAKMDGGDE